MIHSEAYYRIKHVLEHINALYATFVKEASYEYAAKQAERTREKQEKSEEVGGDSGETGTSQDVFVIDAEEVEILDEEAEQYFRPEKGNVVFASAYDKWGFRVQDFADVYAVKMNMSRKVLNTTLWGDFYLNSKQKKIFKKPRSANDMPMFVQLVLQSVFHVYDSIMVKKSKPHIEKICKKLDLKVPPRDLVRVVDNPRGVLQTVMGQWLPVSRAVLAMVCLTLPSPIECHGDRLQALWKAESRGKQNKAEGEEKGEEKKKDRTHVEKIVEVDEEKVEESVEEVNLRRSAVSCDKEGPLVVYIAKILVFPKTAEAKSGMQVAMPGVRAARFRNSAEEAGGKQEGSEGEKDQNDEEGKGKQEEMKEKRKGEGLAELEEDHKFIAFARIFSGTLRKGQEVYLLHSQYTPPSPLPRDGKKEEEGSSLPPHCKRISVGDLYILMGRELEPVESVSAGNVFGIGGIASHIIKTATLSDSLACPSLSATANAVPLVRVAVEAANPMQSSGVHFRNIFIFCMRRRGAL